MSRHTAMNKIIRDANSTNDLYYSDEETLEEVLEYFGGEVTSKEAINALRKNDGDYDGALDYLELQLERKKSKEVKKGSKNEQIKVQKIEEPPMPQIKQSHRKISRQSDDKVQDLSKISRKGSSDFQIPTRKLSNQIQDVDRDHYNSDYPKVNDAHALSNSISVVVIGHVDSGKSTLTGQILHQLNLISQKQIHKNQKQSKQIGKQSFQFAWVMDQNQDERNKGVTIDVGMRNVGYNGKTIVFLDSPGHKQYIPNMINGAVQADYAILVIDGSKFDSGFRFGGQTKEHAYIVRALGVSTMLIAINKMDLLEWSQEQFTKIKNQLTQYLIEIGFQQDKLIFVPISAFHNINVISKKQLKYYNGSPLIQLIGNLDLPLRLVDKPFRLNITNVFESASGKLKGNCISGKIEGGVLKKDDKFVILPVNCQVIVKEIILNDEKVKSATVGDSVDCQIKLIDETFFQNIKAGNVMSSLNYSIPVSNRIIAEILTFQLEMPVLCGTPVITYLGCGKSPGKIQKILKIFDSKNRALTKKQNAKAINSNQCCEVQLSFGSPVCVELFSNFKRFGRVILREKHSTLAVGIIKEILPMVKKQK